MALIFIVISGILYGLLGFSGTKIIAFNSSISNMLFWRFFVASIWMGLASYISRSNFLSYFRKHPSVYFKTFFIGAFFYSGSSIFYFLAAKYTGTGIAMVVFFAYPIFIILLNQFIDKHPASLKMWSAILLILIGLYLTEKNQIATLNLNGVGFALIAAGCYGVYIYLSKRLDFQAGSVIQTCIVCVGSTMLFFILSILDQTINIPNQTSIWLYIGVIGIICTALPIQLLLLGLNKVPADKAALLSVFEPLTTLIIGIVFLHETASVEQFVGMVIILVSAIGVQMMDKSNQQNPHH